MQGIILAAGRGSRLEDGWGRPKCLREVGGVPLVHHQLAGLAAAGVTEVVVVVGFGQEQIREAVGTAATYVVNERFAETNSMVSFWLGQQVVDDDVVVMNSDVFCHPELFGMLCEADGDALLYDSGSGTQAEEMKIRIDDGYLVEMSKTLPREVVSGENVGMLRLTGAAAADTAKAAASIAASGGQRAWLATAINEVAGHRRFRCVDVAGWPWVEIDVPEDLVRARVEVFPEVADALGWVEPAYAGVGGGLRGVS